MVIIMDNRQLEGRYIVEPLSFSLDHPGGYPHDKAVASGWQTP